MTRLFHVSDLHFGCEDKRAVAWFADCVRAEKPDAVAITGDLTMRAKTSEFEACQDWILSLDVPVTVEVGNHDLPYFNLFERFLFPYRKIRRIERLVERELELPGIAIVPLKTTARAQWRLNWSRGHVSTSALRKTMAAIAELPERKVVFVTVHHPLVEAGTKGQALTTGGEAALAALAGERVTAVLSGHVHDAFDLEKQTANGAIRMIGAGTLSKRVRSSPASFNELTVEGETVMVKVRNLEAVPTPAMQIEAVPPDAKVPEPGEPKAPVDAKREPEVQGVD